MSTWVDSMLEPEDGDVDEEGMTIIPSLEPQAVSLMPPPTPPVAPVAPSAKKITWRDFTLEEHVRAWMGIPANSKLKLGKTGKGKYRANVYSPENVGVVTDYHITASAHLNITQGPDGYVISGTVDDLTVSEKKKKW